MFLKENFNIYSEYETPFYLYDLKLLEETLNLLKEESSKYGYHIHYALKANSNNRLLEMISAKGFGADCVSGNEVKRALETGFTNDKVVFAGVGKSDKEINLSIENDIFCFNCESIQEIEIINQLANNYNKTVNIALRINPNVDAFTHKYITTGLEENKFGINMWELNDIIEKLPALANVKLIGLHFHIGSQIVDLTSFKNLCVRVNEIQQWFFERNIIVNHINVGGGLGINYAKPNEEPVVDFQSFFKLFNDLLTLQPTQELHFELGRSVIAQCGTLITKVLYVKNGVKTNFAIVDAGMTELIRPALYQAVHAIENVSNNSEEKEFYDVVGPICESSDCFGKRIELPITKRGDLIAIRSAGAYGEVMASQYNLRNLVKGYYL